LRYFVTCNDSAPLNFTKDLMLATTASSTGGKNFIMVMACWNIVRQKKSNKRKIAD
jgi:hypothetical protein